MKNGLKHIPKKTITTGTIKNLVLPEFNGLTLIIGDNNSGKTTLLKYLFLNTKILVCDDLLIDTSCFSAKERVSSYLREIKPALNNDYIIVITTNNSDVIRELLDNGIKTYRLGKSVRNSDRGNSLLTEVDYMSFTAWDHLSIY